MMITNIMSNQFNPVLRRILLFFLSIIILVTLYFFIEKSIFILLFSTAVLFFVTRGIIAGWYAPAIMIGGGIALLITTAIVLPDVSLSAVDSGSRFLNVFIGIQESFSEQMAGLGLTIMVISGFARYMGEIGAADKLVSICVTPLSKVKSHYVLLGISYVVIQLISMFIPSPSGLGLLMMTTLFPVLLAIGCSRESIAAVIASGVCIDLGPASPGTIFAAQMANIDLFGFIIHEQFPIAVIIIPFIALMHILVLPYWDKKNNTQKRTETDIKETKECNLPIYYAAIPFIPMISLFIFSDFSNNFLPTWMQFNVDVTSSILISLFLAFCLDLLNSKNLKLTINKVLTIFDEMSQSFLTIVVIILCAQVLADGLIKISFVKLLFEYFPSGNNMIIINTLIFTLLIFISSILLGTGTTFNAFAPIASEVAKTSGGPLNQMIVSIHFSSTFGRTLSPIYGLNLAIANICRIRPIEIVKRNVIQISSALALTFILKNFFYIQ